MPCLSPSLTPLSCFIFPPSCRLFLSFALEICSFPLSLSLHALLLLLYFPVAFYRSAPIIISTNSLRPRVQRRPQTRGYFRERISGSLARFALARDIITWRCINARGDPSDMTRRACIALVPLWMHPSRCENVTEIKSDDSSRNEKVNL